LLTRNAEESRTPVASPVHTVVVLIVLGAWTVLGNVLANRLSSAIHPDRMRLYAETTAFEWLLFAFVLLGVRRAGVSVHAVLGERWRSWRELLRDIGIAAAFWVVSIPVLAALGWLLRVAGHGRDMKFMMPVHDSELVAWIALSITAGICEETIFRGYLQRQFLAMTKNAPAAIVLSAAAFGGAHAYQGIRMVILISLFGAMFGTLAYWRGTVRPGMIAHGWQDSSNALLTMLVKH
jgi:membrane protease YdiL (CAAX protease family)